MSLIPSESAATGIASVAQHLNWADIPVEHPAEGIERQMVVGERMMIVRFRFVPFLVTPEHTHMHEQMSLVVSGRVRFFVEGEDRLYGVVNVQPEFAAGGSGLEAAAGK